MVEYILGYYADADGIHYCEVPVELLRIVGIFKDSIDITALRTHECLSLGNYDIENVGKKLYNKGTGRLELGVLDGEYVLELEVVYHKEYGAFRLCENEYIKTKLSESLIDKNSKDFKNVLKYSLVEKMPIGHYISGKYYLSNIQSTDWTRNWVCDINVRFSNNTVDTKYLASFNSTYRMCRIKADMLLQNKILFSNCDTRINKVLASIVTLTDGAADINEVVSSDMHLKYNECHIHAGKDINLFLEHSKVYLEENVNLLDVRISKVRKSEIFIEGNHSKKEVDAFLGEEVSWLYFNRNMRVYVNNVEIDLNDL